jgi:putative hemolysin
LVINESKISTLNKFYDRNKHLKDIDFLNAIIDDLQIKFDIPDEDFKRLPKDGAYITISNHPLGGIDGVLLLKLMLERELILKLLLISLTQNCPLKNYIMPVNPFENHDAKSSVVE